MLRQRLFELALAAAPLAALGCEGGKSPMIDAPDMQVEACSLNYQQLMKSVSEPPPADLLDLVRACEANIASCNDLCRRVLDTEGFSFTTMKDCTVTHSSTDHKITVGYCFIGAEGRRPAGLAGASKRCASVTSGHLARAAFYEAASVHAFVQLARELRRHRAPRALVAAMRRSAAEEIIHAQLMTAHAHARGSTPPPVVVSASRRRSIESIAIENAREGLVGETWAALTATYQALHAPDPALRAAYAKIAADEARHAELALDLDRWARSRLSPAARARVETARRRAITQLRRQVRRAPDRTLVAELGLPDAAAAARMFDGARAALWS